MSTTQLCRKCANRIVGKQSLDLKYSAPGCGQSIKGTAPAIPLDHPPYHLHRGSTHHLAATHPLPFITWVDPKDFAAWYQSLIAELGSYKKTLDGLWPGRSPGISSSGHLGLYSGLFYKVNVLSRVVVRLENAERAEYRQYVAVSTLRLGLHFEHYLTTMLILDFLTVIRIVRST